MILACFQYFSLLYRRSGRFAFDLAAALIFALVFVVDAGKDYAPAVVEIGVFVVVYFVFMIFRTFQVSWQSEALPALARRAGRRAVLAGGFLLLYVHCGLIFLALYLCTLLDPAVREQLTPAAVGIAPLCVAIAMLVAGAVALHFTPLFQADRFSRRGTLGTLGLVLLALGLVSPFIRHFTDSALILALFQHGLPPLNLLIEAAGQTRLSLKVAFESAYGFTYAAVILYAAFTRWRKQDLFLRTDGP